MRVPGREPDSSSCSSGVGVRAVDAIELHEADGAFERIESWLRERGFFAPGGEDLVADLYLGYGLSSTIRRRHSPLPPEPCPLPFAACARAGRCRRPPSSVTTVRLKRSASARGSRRGAPPPTARRSSAFARRSREATSTRSTSCSTSSATFAGDPGTLAARLGRCTAQPRALSRRRLGGRLRLAGAVPRAARPPRLDVPDQGDPPGGWRRPSSRARRRTRPST